jgi:putative transposase
MPWGLVRYQQSGDLHFVTFSCYDRKPLLGSAAARDLFELSLEAMRVRYGFLVFGYVVMPEHVHLIVNQPDGVVLAVALKALKLSVAVQRSERPFWQARCYDFNVFTERKQVEKLRYLHRNPVTRGLVANPADWKWSSFRHYSRGERGVVEIAPEWKAWRVDC